MSKHNLVSMKRTKQDKKRNSAECAIEDRDDFPYGLAVSLDDESLAKLGMKTLPGVGEAFIVVGVGKVKSVSENSNSNRTNRNVTIQLEKLEVGPLKKASATDAVSAAIKDV